MPSPLLDQMKLRLLPAVGLAPPMVLPLAD
jgi:hypothetical protein